MINFILIILFSFLSSCTSVELAANLGKKVFPIKKGIRIAQMVLCPLVRAKLLEVDTLDETKRGTGGFGSTGLK